MNKSSNNLGLIGSTGEFYVCAELGKRNILPLLTSKNNPLFDIVAVTSSASKTIYIQVKTMSEKNNQGWKFGLDICLKKNNPLLFVLLVNIKQNDIDYYIYEYDKLSEKISELYKKYLDIPKKNGEKRKEVGFRWLDLKDFSSDDLVRKNNWQLLGI